MAMKSVRACILMYKVRSTRDLWKCLKCAKATRHIPAVGSDWEAETRAWFHFLRGDDGRLTAYSVKFFHYANHYGERVHTDPLIDELHKQFPKPNDTGTKTT